MRNKAGEVGMDNLEGPYMSWHFDTSEINVEQSERLLSGKNKTFQVSYLKFLMQYH